MCQTKHSHPVRGAYVDFSVNDRWGDEFIAGSKVVTASGRLIAVVKFARQISRVESMQNRRICILRSPKNRIVAAIGRNTGRGSRVRKNLRGLG